MNTKFVVVTKITASNCRYKVAINAGNIIEVSPKENSSEHWLKYWDGEKIRNTLIAETVDNILFQTNQK